jgi:ABC-type antimicrobial peptide transport system permease subunit
MIEVTKIRTFFFPSCSSLATAYFLRAISFSWLRVSCFFFLFLGACAPSTGFLNEFGSSLQALPVACAHYLSPRSEQITNLTLSRCQPLSQDAGARR